MNKTNKKNKTQKSPFMDWLKDQVDRNPQVRKMADEMLNEMRVEQDLAALREERGISQSQLAKLLGVSQPAIAKIESGKVKNLTLKTLVRYATALGGEVKITIDRIA
ncbi:MAG TPA: helix-turn-helix transcriptional regulator [bacterium]|nr:helix-turn-helix transcriptional regulator [bacterium]